MSCHAMSLGCAQRRLLLGRRAVTYTMMYRWKSGKSFSKTLNLPKTSLPLSMKCGVTAKRELDIQSSASWQNLYAWQREQTDRKREFVLHDGPPYANGQPHVGHALNKILKDVTCRYHLLRGCKVHYVPGWDCHGVPIEQKALAGMTSDHHRLDPVTIRSKARAFAKEAIQLQSRQFKRWGVMADWDKNCYYTYTPEYEARQLDIFYKMYSKGLIYQDYMPVFWSPSSRTALAEAELEYNEEHVSTAAYVSFVVSWLPECISQQLPTGVNTHALIWTTTPWTLPANQAICYGPGIQYQFVWHGNQGPVYLIAADLKPQMEQLLKGPLKVIANCTGRDLAGGEYIHPLTNETLPLLPANHVTVAKGTGLVHTAPAHGVEDFQVAVRHGLPVECIVNEAGEYLEKAGHQLTGRPVLKDGNKQVLEMLRAQGSVVHVEDFTHSYPYDWRTKQPVIVRASTQWFVKTSALKERALESLSHVAIHPPSSEQGLVSMLANRTYWCISRQRAWGVPIPVFYEAQSGTPLLSRASIDHLHTLVSKHGTDCWWQQDVSSLLPPEVVRASGFKDGAEFVKGNDVLDIWFDSGVSWAAVLQGRQADVYLEGLDQFGGWFQSSLLTSTAVQAHAPYKNLVVHGFAMDEQGRKMSKSEGNVVDPDIVINGGKDKDQEPAYGADVLRWWAVQAGLDSKVNIGPAVLARCNEAVFKIRKSLRYLLGNVADFVPAEHSVPYKAMGVTDRHMLNALAHFLIQVQDAYDTFQFSRVPTLLEQFIHTQLSSPYCHITKDRLYCESAESEARRAAQTVQYHVLTSLLHVLGPVLPHLTEEVFQYVPSLSEQYESAFMRRWESPPTSWQDADVDRMMAAVITLREEFNASIPSENPLEYDIVIAAKPPLFSTLKAMQSELTSSQSQLCEVFQCSTVSLLSKLPLVIPDEAQVSEGTCPPLNYDGPAKEYKYLLIVLPADKCICVRCRKYTSEHEGEVCPRCSDVLGNGWES